MLISILLSLSLAEAESFDRTQVPAPLERSEFTLPKLQQGSLSNGVEILLVEDHDHPLVRVKLVFEAGGFADPPGQEGLAGSAYDMLNEGAGGMSAMEISTALRRLATHLGTSGGLDGGRVTLDTLTRNLPASLDLMAAVALEPEFPEADWDRLRKQLIQDVASARTEPSKMASRALSRTLFGDTYAGRFKTEESLNAISVEDMKAWAATALVPGNARFLVGGDTTLEEITALLEARFGTWSGEGEVAVPTPAVHSPEQTTLYLVNKPGAAQSVIRMGRFAGHRTDPTYTDLSLGNKAFGGMFMARLNMNLREDKGYTYGARSWVSSNHAGSRWLLSTSVRTDVTGASLQEIVGELSGIGGELGEAPPCGWFKTRCGSCPEPERLAATRPITMDEIGFSKSNAIQGYPSRFEKPDYLLDQHATVARYGLPDDWLESYIPRVEAVTAELAQNAFTTAVANATWAIVVVGDLTVVRPQLVDLGFPMVELDADGTPVQDGAAVQDGSTTRED